MTNGHAPDYRLFATNARRGWTLEFVESLEVGVPQRAPDHVQASRTSAAQSIRNTAVRRGIPISIRTIDGAVWVCRLKPEDVKA